MKKYFLILIFLNQSVFSQSKIDSLSNLYNAARNDSTRLTLGAQLSMELNNSDPLLSIEICKKNLNRLSKTKSVSAKKLLELKMSYLHTLGNCYRNVGDNQLSLSAFLSELAIAQQSGNKKSEASILVSIGNAYQTQRMNAEALNYYRKSLKISVKDSDARNIAMALGNIGILYYSNNPDSSLKYYVKSLQAAQMSGMKDREGFAGWMLNNIGNWHLNNGNTDSALYYFNKSLAVRESIDHRLGQSLVHRDLSGLYYQTHNPEKAMEHINASIRIGEESNLAYVLDESYGFRSTLRSEKGDYKGALEDHRKHLAVRDSLNNENDSKSLIQQSMRYEYGRKFLSDSLTYVSEKNLQQKEIQKQRLMRNGFIGGFMVVLLFAGVFFAQRNKIKAGKKLSDKLLLNILPEGVAEELKSKGSAEAKQFDAVTVMFTDFKNFTQISEKLSPTELVAEIHTCFKAFDEIITFYNIEKIKTIGDAYMCAGGLPVINKTNAEDVLNAALQIQNFMQQHAAQRRSDGKEVFEIRIGIHTGPVVAGIVGVKKFAYDIWGDTVNIASRMESCGEAGKVNISGSTYELVKDKFNCIHRGKIQAKNKGEIDMYFLDSVSLKT